jgi:LPXTG-motif cell wall-anchored protein
MKKMKKFLALLIAMAMVLGMSTALFAQTVDVNSGDGSIKITNAAQEKDYSIYLLFDASYSEDGISYKVPNGKEFTGNTWFTVDDAGNVLAVNGADITTEAFKTWATSFGTQIGETVTAEDNTVVFDNIPYGYYYIASTLGGILTVDSTNPDAEVIDKNETGPEIEEDEFKTAGDETAQLGDDVDFTVDFTATNYVTKDGETTQITDYTITDEPTALSIKADSIKITIGDDVLYDATAEEPVTNDNIEVTVSDAGKMTIVLTWAEEADEDGVQKTIYPYSCAVKIEYTATVTNVGADPDGIKNKATITYNDTSTDTEVEVKTYQMTVNKVNNENYPLTGAEFELYRGEETDPLAVVDITEEGDAVRTYRVATSEDAEEDTTTIIKAYVGELEPGEGEEQASGNSFIIKGLDGADTYSLKETKAPAGYNIITEDNNTLVIMGNANQDDIEIVNQAGKELPSTGGIGTTIFYITGAVLVIGAGVVLITRRRMDAQ